MAVYLKHAQIGWKALEVLINAIIDAINSNAPVAGKGIYLAGMGEQGTMINASDQGQQPSQNSPQQQQGGGGGVPVTIQAFDSDNNPVMLTVMTDGRGFGASTLAWQPITVVDPSTCAQSTQSLLGQASQ